MRAYKIQDERRRRRERSHTYAFIDGGTGPSATPWLSSEDIIGQQKEHPVCSHIFLAIVALTSRIVAPRFRHLYRLEVLAGTLAMTEDLLQMSPKLDLRRGDDHRMTAVTDPNSHA